MTPNKPLNPDYLLYSLSAEGAESVHGGLYGYDLWYEYQKGLGNTEVTIDNFERKFAELPPAERNAWQTLLGYMQYQANRFAPVTQRGVR